jgi:hypothetical protein
MAKGWAVKKVKGGHVLTWDGDEWGMSPANLAWCQEYLARLEERYPEGGAWLTYQTQLRTRGGPWRYTFPDGDTEVVHVERLSDAKSVLRHRLRRKTLPAGIEWTLEVNG